MTILFKIRQDFFKNIFLTITVFLKFLYSFIIISMKYFSLKDLKQIIAEQTFLVHFILICSFHT